MKLTKHHKESSEKALKEVEKMKKKPMTKDQFKAQVAKVKDSAGK